MPLPPFYIQRSATQSTQHTGDRTPGVAVPRNQGNPLLPELGREPWSPALLSFALAWSRSPKRQARLKGSLATCPCSGVPCEVCGCGERPGGRAGPGSPVARGRPGLIRGQPALITADAGDRYLPPHPVSDRLGAPKVTSRRHLSSSPAGPGRAARHGAPSTPGPAAENRSPPAGGAARSGRLLSTPGSQARSSSPAPPPGKLRRAAPLAGTEKLAAAPAPRNR